MHGAKPLDGGNMPRRGRNNFRFVCAGCGWGSWTQDDHKIHIDECAFTCFCGKYPGPPIPGVSGRWIEAPSFVMKSFGHFVCKNQSCQAYWKSAHARSDCKQACKECNTYVKPCCMWRNDRSNTRQVHERKTEDPPHRADLCAACRKGLSCTGVA